VFPTKTGIVWKVCTTEGRRAQRQIGRRSVVGEDVSIDGYLGVEFQYANRSSSDRFYCVNGRFYTFSSSWPSTQPCPAAITRIVNSFRLLKRRAPQIASVSFCALNQRADYCCKVAIASVTLKMVRLRDELTSSISSPPETPTRAPWDR